jgi:hypothetical protein
MQRQQCIGGRHVLFKRRMDHHGWQLPRACPTSR